MDQLYFDNQNIKLVSDRLVSGRAFTYYESYFDHHSYSIECKLK